jgi:hypothetical protein
LEESLLGREFAIYTVAKFKYPAPEYKNSEDNLSLELCKCTKETNRKQAIGRS